MAADAMSDEEAAASRPVRFLWSLDSGDRFGSTDFALTARLGPNAPRPGETPAALIARLRLDPDNAFAQAIASRRTFSAVRIAWPGPSGASALVAQISGAPVFDRDRMFCGFRGFGIFSGEEAPLASAPSHAPAEAQTHPADTEAEAPVELPPTMEPTRVETPLRGGRDGGAEIVVLRPGAALAPGAPNVVSLRPHPFSAIGAEPEEPETRGPDDSVELNAEEQDAFREIALALGARPRMPRAVAAEAEPLRPSASEASADEQPPDETPAAGAEPAASRDRDAFALLDVLPIGALVTRGGEAVYANRTLLDLVGFTSVEALRAAGGAERIFAAGESSAVAPTAETGIALTAADGQTIKVDAQARAISWEGAPAILISMRRSREADRPPESFAPERQAGERDWRAASTAAETASARKTEFLARVSHEIRTPLHAILGFAEVMMEERFGAIGNERYKDYIKDIHASGRHVMSLANDLLDLSKIEAGKLEMAFAPIDANRIIRECVALMQPQAARERVIVRLSLFDKLPNVMADERSLRQIMFNLMSNAVKFNEPGGQVIVSTAVDEAGHALIRVRDTGVGMNESELGVALEPFRRVGGAQRDDGTGLGLPLTKALVEANHADFSIKSRKEQGTLVEVAFPAVRAAQ